jgi:Catalytic LigB subunit of aromatic ring-opening dioxygenase
MSPLVAGVGMSHSSLVALPDAQFWRAHGSIDRRNPHLRDRAGNEVTFAELEQANGNAYESESSAEQLAGQVERMQVALARLRDGLAALEPDVLVVFGDDQQEFHDETNMPALAVYYGDELVMGTTMRFATYQEELGDVSPLMEAYAMDARHRFPGHAPFARHLIASLLEQGFDVGASGGVPDDGVSGLGHSYGIVETTLLHEPGSVPLVPVFVNTYWPPNQVPVSRSWELGVAVRAAVDSFPEELRVAVVASGGLSHFSTDEELDRRVLDACARRDEAALRGLEPALLNGGSSEIRNWIAVSAACHDLSMAWHEYLPVYRTPVGTGVGLAFALWSAA